MPAFRTARNQKTGEGRGKLVIERETSRCLKDSVVGLMRGVFNGRADVLPFEKGIVGQNLVEARTIREKLKNVADANALPADAGAASALAFFDRDSLESVGAHSSTAVYSSTYACILTLASLAGEAGEAEAAARANIREESYLAPGDIEPPEHAKLVEVTLGEHGTPGLTSDFLPPGTQTIRVMKVVFSGPCD